MNPPGAIPPIYPSPKPAVVSFYRIWCALLALAYLGVAGYEFAKFSGKIEPQLGVFSELASENDPDLRARMVQEEKESSFFGIMLGAFLAIIMLLGLFSPRASWSWGYGFAPIIVSLFPFFVTVAAIIPLLIFWAKPETKAYYFIRP